MTKPVTGLCVLWPAPEGDMQAVVLAVDTLSGALRSGSFLRMRSYWSAVLSPLKSLLETVSPLPQEPWLVPNG
ncbi:hypothetical protein [Streptomyces sp. Act143]|uniref:hypothetical protein n=1 Tax=Streptomyces sp. Act143 TaxID=2200760 RepID=UPI00215A4B03|nr:hypothetical protein [Streptomyces sp. Act143]